MKPHADAASPIACEAMDRASLPSRPLVVSPPEAWPGVSLEMYRHPPGGVARHRPREHVLVLNRAGRVLIDETVEGVTTRAWAGPGNFSLTPAGQLVQRAWKGRPEVLLLRIDPALVEGAAEDLEADLGRTPLRARLAQRDPDLHSLGHLLLTQATTHETGHELMVDALARALAVRLLQRCGAAPATSAAPTLRPRRFARVIEYMRAHLDHPLRVAELARIAGLSPSHFTRAFSQARGQSPHAQLRRLRLDQAQILLTTTKLEITEIALACGFTHAQHFATTFRRDTGLTPSAWRNALERPESLGR